MPSPLGIGELPYQARVNLWNYIFTSLSSSEGISNGSFGERTPVYGNPWKILTYDLHRDFFGTPIDEYENIPYKISRDLKNFIREAPYNKIFDFIEHLSKHEACPKDLFVRFFLFFEDGNLAYRFLPEEKIIVPRASEMEDLAINAALESSRDRYKGAYEHLKTSLTFLRDNDPRQSIHESMSAAESLIRVLTGESTFNGAMKILTPRMNINPNMQSGFKSLYNYTSDEKGIRHSLLEENSSVTFDDAQFMLSACAAFISYVINKQDMLPSPQK